MAEETKANPAQGEDLELETLEDVAGGAKAYSYAQSMKCSFCGRIFPPETEKCPVCGRTLQN